MLKLGEAYRDAEVSTTTESKMIPPGGYVCTIKAVTNHQEGDKPYLEIVYDIREGKYADHYAGEWGQENLWAHTNRHYYSEKSLGMFKGFLKAVDESNNTNFEEQAEFGLDEQRLIGKAIGYIIGEEEYESNFGEIRTRLQVRSTRPVQAIREGRYKQPELKKLETASAEALVPSKPDTPMGDDLPF